MIQKRGSRHEAAPWPILGFFTPFLPSVPLHAEPTIPGTPADLLRFRSRRGCRGEYTGRCARFRAAEYRNCL